MHDLDGGLCAERAWQLPEAELLQVCGALARLRSKVEAAFLAAVAEVDRRRAGAVPDGLRESRSGIGSSTESFLRTSAPLAPGQARDDVAAARALSPDGEVKKLAPLLACGDITRAHVDVATRCQQSIPEHLRHDGDRTAIAEFFVGLAPTRHAWDLRRSAAALLERLAPGVQDRFDPRAHERRFFDTSTDSTGMLLGHFALDAVAGATLLSAVEACAAPLPTDGDGRDDRTAPQRRADALVTVADRARAVTGPVRSGASALESSSTPHPSRSPARSRRVQRLFGPGACWTEAGQDLGAGAVRRLSCDAVLQRCHLARHPRAALRLSPHRGARRGLAGVGRYGRDTAGGATGTGGPDSTTTPGAPSRPRAAARGADPAGEATRPIPARTAGLPRR